MTVYVLMSSFSYLDPVCCSMSSSNGCFLICKQLSQEADQRVYYSHLFQIFPQFVVICTVKGFGIVIKAKIDVFLELSSFFDVLLKPGLETFDHFFTNLWDECNCAVVWTFFGIAFLCDWNENLHFSVLWPLLSFPNLLAYWVQHFHSIIF